MSTLSAADRRHFDLLVTQQLNDRRRFGGMRQRQREPGATTGAPSSV